MPEDGRATDVFLTTVGTEVVKRLRSQALQALAPLTGQLRASEQQLLEHLLQRMLELRKD